MEDTQTLSLREVAQSLKNELAGMLGAYFKDNGTFYSYSLVTRAMLPVRLGLEEDRVLNEEGERFFFRSYSFLADLLRKGFSERGLKPEETVQTDVLKVSAFRVRDGLTEEYHQSVYEDAQKYLLVRSKALPYCGPWTREIKSAVLPSPDYLYLYGAFLMNSPQAEGNWPRFPAESGPGGRKEDFQAAKRQLVSHLHKDCGLPENDLALRELSEGVVFPPYGWTENEYGDFNLIHLFSKILVEKKVSRGIGVVYLQNLLGSQSFEVRVIAARALLVLDIAPRHIEDAYLFYKALTAADHREILPFLLSSRWRIERGVNSGEEPTSEWRETVVGKWNEWAHWGETYGQTVDPVMEDERFTQLAKFHEEEPEEALEVLKALKTESDSWLINVLYLAQVLQLTKDAEAEAALKALILNDCPGSEAHVRLGTLLKLQGRKAEAMELFKDGVKRWPYLDRLIDCCLWLKAAELLESSES